MDDLVVQQILPHSQMRPNQPGALQKSSKAQILGFF
jgi:hypothetical protein